MIDGYEIAIISYNWKEIGVLYLINIDAGDFESLGVLYLIYLRMLYLEFADKFLLLYPMHKLDLISLSVYLMHLDPLSLHDVLNWLVF